MTDRSEKLLRVRYLVSSEPHIRLDCAKCADCQLKGCLYFCPAGCFTQEDGKIKYEYAGCLECGACRATCPGGALTWDYPLGGFGVSYRLG
jgi:ferredoxin like protein